MVSMGPTGSWGQGLQEVRAGTSGPPRSSGRPPTGLGTLSRQVGCPRRDKHGAETGPLSHLTLDLGLPGIQGVALSAPLCAQPPPKTPQKDSHLLCSRAWDMLTVWTCIPGARQAGSQWGKACPHLGTPPPHTPPPALFRPQASSGSCTRLPSPWPCKPEAPRDAVERKCCSWGSPTAGRKRGLSDPRPGTWTNGRKELPRIGCLPPGPQEEPALPSFPSIPPPPGGGGAES